MKESQQRDANVARGWPQFVDDVEFLRNFAATLRRSAERARAEGRVLAPECSDVQAPIFERAAERIVVAEREVRYLRNEVTSMKASLSEALTENRLAAAENTRLHGELTETLRIIERLEERLDQRTPAEKQADGGW